MNNVPFPDVFISYASIDGERVFAIADAIEQLGLSIWIDRTGIAGGTAYGAEIASALKGAKAVVLMCSAGSLASKNVRQEIMLAWRYGTPILPLLIEPVDFPDDIAYWLEGFPWIDVQRTSGDGWLQSVIQALARHSVISDPEVVRKLADAGGAELPPTNLPSPSTPLVGRQQTVAEVLNLLAHGRWVTLTGPGGTGKTRLSIELGRASSTNYRDGVWFIDLSLLSDPTLVLPMVAETLGINTEAGEEPADALGRELHSKQVLLILDNFEHVSAASGQIADLQSMVEGLDVLATSRVALQTPAEWLFEVPQLTLPDLSAQPTPAALAQNPAIALFVERAVAAKPDFVLTEGNARAVAKICLRLEGLPLAIELAAARVRLLPPQVLLTRLGSRLSLLTRGSDVAGDRQRSLRDTIAWSYDLLSPLHQHLFRRAAVLRGPSDLPSVAAVAGKNDVADSVQALIDQSLVRVQKAEDTGQPRVLMLETIREFAAEQLELAGETDQTRAAHASFFSKLVGEMESEITSSNPGPALARMRSDDANLRTALDWYAERNDDPDGLVVLSSLRSFWIRTGRLREGRDRLMQALDRYPYADPGIRGSALHALGRLSSSLGDSSEATELFQKALVDLFNAGDRSAEADVHYQLGWLSERAGDLSEATTKYELSLAIYESLGNDAGVALLVHDLGMLKVYEGGYQAALDAIGRSVAIYRSLSDARHIAEGLSDLGSVEMLSGDFVRSRQHLAESVSLFRTLDDEHAIATVSTNLGRAFQLSGDHGQAVPLFGGVCNAYAKGRRSGRGGSGIVWTGHDRT